MPARRLFPPCYTRRAVVTKTVIQRAGRIVLDLVYPPACVLCGGGGSFLCGTCEATLPRADGERCPRCWLPTGVEHCEPEAAFTYLRSRYRYDGDVRRLILRLKFSRLSALAEPLGREIGRLIVEEGLEVDGLVPVPLRTLRQRERGFNQAAMLAKEAASLCDVPVLNLLKRTGDAMPQARTASAEERRRNVQGAFSLRRKRHDVQGMRLLLVDDVATTGATLDACARVLLAAGAASVGAVTLARED